MFRCADAANMPLNPQNTPIVTTSNARARVIGVLPEIGDIPGTFVAEIVIGRADVNGINTFVISADGVTQNVIVIIESGRAESFDGNFPRAGGVFIRVESGKIGARGAKVADTTVGFQFDACRPDAAPIVVREDESTLVLNLCARAWNRRTKN